MRRRGLALALGGALAVAGVVALGVAHNLAPPSPPTASGPTPVDGCVACHAAPLDDPGGAHAAAVVGCASCHLGDPSGATAALAHVGLEREPGALDTVARTCGRCHAREVERVRGSLMATNAGLVAVDRWAFGETASPDGDETIAAVLAKAGPSPAEDHLRRLCAGCHLGTRRDNRDDAIIVNGSGCGACHGGPRALAAGGPSPRHLPLDGRVGDDRCLGCHSRSSRVSLAYHGQAEVASDARPAGCGPALTLHDQRPGCAMPADVHARAGLACIDCHLHGELMGDGLAHRHADEAVEVTCASCHGEAGEVAARDARSPPVQTFAAVAAADPIVKDLVRLAAARLPGFAVADDRPTRVGRRGGALWNVRPAADTRAAWELVGKLDGKVHPIRPTPDDLDHRRAGHARLTCSACHATWAPRCPTCHTTFDPAGHQWDFGRAAEAPGRWVEATLPGGAPDVGLPLLGVDARGRIAPAAPGMVARLDLRGAHGPVRNVALYAPIAPHTTGPARACATCHDDPAALPVGDWTRVGARSLDPAERDRVLAVGQCLRCHEASPTASPAPATRP